MYIHGITIWHKKRLKKESQKQKMASFFVFLDCPKYAIITHAYLALFICFKFSLCDVLILPHDTICTQKIHRIKHHVSVLSFFLLFFWSYHIGNFNKKIIIIYAFVMWHWTNLHITNIMIITQVCMYFFYFVFFILYILLKLLSQYVNKRIYGIIHDIYICAFFLFLLFIMLYKQFQDIFIIWHLHTTKFELGKK